LTETHTLSLTTLFRSGRLADRERPRGGADARHPRAPRLGSGDRSDARAHAARVCRALPFVARRDLRAGVELQAGRLQASAEPDPDRKSTRLNSSHSQI